MMKNFDVSRLKEGMAIKCISCTTYWSHGSLTVGKVYELKHKNGLYIVDDGGICRNEYLWNKKEHAVFVVAFDNKNEEFE